MEGKTWKFVCTIFVILSGLSDQVECGGSHQHMERHMQKQHNHYVPTPSKDPVSILEERRILQDVDHLKEDLKELFSEEQMNQMTPQELEFHYFKHHDFDNNDRLDGLEIINAVAHILPDDPDLGLRNKEQKFLSDEETWRLQQARARNEEQMQHFFGMIDRMLLDSDKDKDGFITYDEYVQVRRTGFSL